MKFIKNKLLIIFQIALILTIIIASNYVSCLGNSAEITNSNKIFESFQKHRKFLKKNLPKSISPKADMNGKIDSVTNQDPAARNSNLMQTALNSVTKNDASIEAGNGPTYYNGWVRYFKYTDSSIKKPSAFFKNVQFEEQAKLYPGQDYSEKEGEDYKYIPKNTFFYAVLFKDSLNIAASKIVN